MKKLTIIIPARYGSSRFAGKPLTQIAGKSMLQRVFSIAQKACEKINNADIIIATEDERIIAHTEEIGAKAVMTSNTCKTGSDRALAACEQLDYTPDIVLNLQGDAPLTPPSFVTSIAQTLIDNDDVDVATPIVQLSWNALDTLRKNKETTPFSGTTAIIDNNNNALWFSKNIIPALRKERDLRQNSDTSPIYKHVGLYGYKYAALQKFVTLPEGVYEKLEGLEQLRMIESEMIIRTVKVDYGNIPPIGVDTPEDAKQVEAIIAEFGELI